MATTKLTEYRLQLMRHAQAQRANAEMPDLARPLDMHGRAQAQQMGHTLKASQRLPECILSSPALRTQETSTHLGLGSIPIICEDRLYGARASEILELIRDIDRSIQTLLIVAHNPAISQLAAHLAGRFLGDLPPAACVTLDFNLPSWQEIPVQLADSVNLQYPSNG